MIDFPEYKDIVSFYGKPGPDNLGRVRLPFKLQLAWPNPKTGKPSQISSFLAHQRVVSVFEDMYIRAWNLYGEAQFRILGLHVFGGCYNYRRMTGDGGRWSVHSWGAAIDIDPVHNRYSMGHAEARLAHPDYDGFWIIVEDLGLVGLGRRYDKDWMHIQAVKV